MIHDSIREAHRLDVAGSLRGVAGKLSRFTDAFVRKPAQIMRRAPAAMARLEEIDRRIASLNCEVHDIDQRFANLDREVRNRLPAGPNHEANHNDFSKLGIELVNRNVQALKQNWPLTSNAFSRRLICNAASPVPPLTSRARIQGAKCVKDFPEDHHFLNSGFADLRAVYNIAGVFGVDLDKSLATLDFGVGCARMGRHLPENAQAGFTGVDVDSVNIAWCRKNMEFGRYEVIQPASVIPTADRHFDLIYSHSVFTHLSPAEQNHWLCELGRVSKGIIILSVHGMYSSFRIAGWSKDAKVLTHWLNDGFVDAGVPNPDISDVVDPEYYRDVAHTPHYIRNHWSKFLEVVEIIPGGFGHIHDAVVLRSK